MSHDVSHLISRLINGPLPLRQVCFAGVTGSVPALACQVDFPRLEIVLEGSLMDAGIAGEAPLMTQHDVCIFQLAAGTASNGRHRPAP